MNHNELYERWAGRVPRGPRPDRGASVDQGADAEISTVFTATSPLEPRGLRGVIGAGNNRMNIYTIRRATQGLANYLLAQSEEPHVAISYEQPHQI